MVHMFAIWAKLVFTKATLVTTKETIKIFSNLIVGLMFSLMLTILLGDEWLGETESKRIIGVLINVLFGLGIKEVWVNRLGIMNKWERELWQEKIINGFCELTQHVPSNLAMQWIIMRRERLGILLLSVLGESCNSIGKRWTLDLSK